MIKDTTTIKGKKKMTNPEYFDDDGKYIGPENRSCPVGACSGFGELVGKNRMLAKRITQVGGTTLVVISLMVTILGLMAKSTLDIAQDSNRKVGKFIEQHDQSMIASEKIVAGLVVHMENLQEQNKIVSNIQRQVVSEVAVLKSRSHDRYKDGSAPTP